MLEISVDRTGFDARAGEGDEIERRFLVRPAARELLVARAVGVHAIRQAYIGGGKQRFRVRQSTDMTVDPPTTAYSKTRKVRIDARRRRELEGPIEQAEFERGWSGTPVRLHKTRYGIPYGQHTIELDEFEPSGLLVGEVEFKTDADSDAFVVPDFFGAEITGLSGWGSRALAERPVGAAELSRIHAALASGVPIGPREPAPL